MTASPFGPVRIGQALPELQSGLRRLTNDGWTQNTYYDDMTGAYCSLGVMGHPWPTGDRPAATNVLARAIRDSGWTPATGPNDYLFSEWSSASVIARWNDEDGRTWEQVRAIWESAINIAQTFAPPTPTPNVTPTK